MLDYPAYHDTTLRYQHDAQWLGSGGPQELSVQG